MADLYVFDKDGTLTQSKSGGFVQSPEDQELFPGVREKLDRLRAEGHILAIASNQGGCDWHEILAVNLKLGQRFKVKSGNPSCDSKDFLARSIGANPSPRHEGSLLVETDSQRFNFRPEQQSDRILVQYKTIESAIKEVAFAADLCGIEEAYFCPDMAGEVMYLLGGDTERGWQSLKVSCRDFQYSTDLTVSKHRKPDPGMLLYAKIIHDSPNRCVMVGDLKSDCQAALAAGFEFIEAQDWRFSELLPQK